MFEKFRERSLEPENLDKGTYTPEEYEGCLVELRRVNEWLGDANALRDSLLKEIEGADLRSFSVLDVGAVHHQAPRSLSLPPHRGSAPGSLPGASVKGFW